MLKKVVSVLESLDGLRFEVLFRFRKFIDNFFNGKYEEIGRYAMTLIEFVEERVHQANE